MRAARGRTPLLFLFRFGLGFGLLRFGGGLRLFLGRRQDLLHVAPLGDLQLVLPLVVLLFQLGLGDLDALGEVRRDVWRAQCTSVKVLIWNRSLNPPA